MRENSAFSNDMKSEDIIHIEDKAYTIKNESPIEETINIAVYNRILLPYYS